MLSVFRELEKVSKEPFKGVLVVDKPVGITSHDVVDYFRKEYSTREVGHAGALDPFAQGEIIILLGKSLKDSDKYINLRKKYLFKSVLGIKTLSGDNQERITKYIPCIFDKSEINKKTISFMEEVKNNYVQTVPILSSVKVSGYKLRDLTRRSKDIIQMKYKEFLLSEFKNEKILISTSDKYELEPNRDIVIFKLKNNNICILLPKKDCKINEFSNIKVEEVSLDSLKGISYLSFKESANLLGISSELLSISMEVEVSSGTYIRKLTEDMTEGSMGIPSSLYFLQRKYLN